LAVTLTVPRDGLPSTRTAARLLRWRDLDPALAGAFAGESLPEIGPGQCAVADGEAVLDDALAAASPDSSVELLDAGEIVATAAGHSTRLVPRYEPEILPFVSGVAYVAEGLPEAETAELIGGDVLVSAFGGEDVGRFDATATLPPLPRLLTIDGHDPAESSTIEISRARDLELRWSAGGRLGDDTILVELVWASGQIRCRPAEEGRLRIPEAKLAVIPEGSDLQIAVERGARAPFSAPGLEAGELEAAVRDAVGVKVW